MPIKLPKAFPRRKSSGNALEEVPNPPQPSFRVFERAPDGSKSFDGGNTLKRMTQKRPLSAGHQLENALVEDDRPDLAPHPNNRGSGGTQKSSSSGGLYDTSSSSARFSSSSTLPSTSSVENSADDYAHAAPKSDRAFPIPPTPPTQPAFSLRNAGRSFSFGRKAAQAAYVAQQAQQAQEPQNDSSPLQSHQSYGNIPDVPYITRPRACTETSGSTATPPKLLDTELDFGYSGDNDDFGNMFDGFGSDRAKLSRSPDNLEVPNVDQSTRPKAELATNPYLSGRSPYTPPPPLNVDHTRPVIASPYSAHSQTSQDGLMASSPQEEQDMFQDEERYRQSNRPGFPMLRNVISSSKYSPVSQSRQQQPGLEMRRNSAYNAHRASTPMEDTDALLVMESINANRKMNRQSTASEDILLRAVEPPRRSADSEDSIKWSKPSPGSSPKLNRKPVSQSEPRRPVTLLDSEGPSVVRRSGADTESTSQNGETLLYDPSFREMARSADQYQAGRLSPPKRAPPKVPSKVMTPAQFQRYRKEQEELSRSKSNASKSDGSEDGDTYEDDDEERNRQLVKQRRKQEAHLAVYRQQMMKVTGEQPSKLSTPSETRPGLERVSMSAPNLSVRMSSMNLTADKLESGKSSDDEDDDIPLGILAAHGFPSKEKPPNQLSRQGSNPNIRYTSETYPPPSVSNVGGSVAGGGSRGGLPPFARNLPKDPYYGASIVNSSNRESLAFGNSTAGSVYGGSQRNLHPGGLVGVIATEERERALRRGSPNAPGGYGLPGSGLPLPPGMVPPGMSPPPSSGDQAQMQMTQQMSQMMQMQMQWMQQMMAMQQGLQPGQPVPQMPQMPFPQPMMQPGMLSPPGLQVPQIRMQRPYSSVGPLSAPTTANAVQQQQRAMSMLSPSTGNQWNRRSMAPSLMPNMMSGARDPGQGYAPSMAPSERSNIGQPSRYRPVSIAPMDEQPKKSSRASTMSGTTALKGWDGRPDSTGNRMQQQKTVRAVTGAGSDDDDEEGWEEMRKKREKLLKGKKKDHSLGNGLGNIFYPGT